MERPHPPVTYPVLYVVADSPVELTARPLGVDFNWQPSTFLTTPAAATTVYSGSADQLYTIRITTATGCATVDTLVVKIVANIDIMVPTAFTPNGDGRNDLLRPVLFGMKELNYFRVYNRWGQLLYQSHDPAERLGRQVCGEATGQPGGGVGSRRHRFRWTPLRQERYQPLYPIIFRTTHFLYLSLPKISKDR
jgi:hypothetical protein